MSNSQQNCPNCRSKLVGNFCHACGQKDIGKRLNSRLLVSSAFEALTEMDSKLWRTLCELSTNPGQVALNYIGGERTRYINPIKYFFVCLAIFVAVLIMSGGLEAEIQAQIASEEVQGLAMLALEGVMRQYRDIMSLITVPLFAFFIRWQYWRSKRNYAETLSLVCFIVAQAYLFSIPVTLLQWSTGNFDQSPRTWFMLVLFIFSAKVFYELNWVKALLASAVTTALYAAASFASGSILIALRMGGII